MALYIESLHTWQIENLTTPQIETLLGMAPLVIELLTTEQIENLTVEQIETLIPPPVIFPILTTAVQARADAIVNSEVVVSTFINSWV